MFLIFVFLPRSGYVPKPRVAASATLGHRVYWVNRNAVASTLVSKSARNPFRVVQWRTVHPGLKQLGFGTLPLRGTNQTRIFKVQSSKYKARSSTFACNQTVPSLACRNSSTRRVRRRRSGVGRSSFARRSVVRRSSCPSFLVRRIEVTLPCRSMHRAIAMCVLLSPRESRLPNRVRQVRT